MKKIFFVLVLIALNAQFVLARLKILKNNSKKIFLWIN
jgi:hypothetical protein